MKELKGILRNITNKVQSFIKRMAERIVTVPTEQEKQERIKKEKRFWKKVDKFTICIAKSIWRLFWMGVILHVAEYFWPELPNKVPVIYGLYDYLMQIPEFIFWSTLKGVQAIFEGNFLEFSSKEFWPSVKNGIECFIEWMKTL